MAPIEHTMKRRSGGGGIARARANTENYLYTPEISHAVSAAGENNLFRARNNRRQSFARPHPHFLRS